jgi:hypothetical protein
LTGTCGSWRQRFCQDGWKWKSTGRPFGACPR